MKKAKNLSNKLIAVLLSAALAFTPVLSSVPAYAAEVESESQIENDNTGTMPKADELDNEDLDGDSDKEDLEEAAGEEQAPADAGDAANDGAVSEDDSNDGNSDGEQGTDTENKAEENTEEKTESKTEAKPEETDTEPVYEEVMEEESQSETGSQEESETESEEMSLEEVGATFPNVTASDIKAGGWNESIYAEIPKVTDASAITEVSWTIENVTKKLDEDGLKYLVRIPKGETGVRIDIPGLKAGTYDLSITVTGSDKLTKTGIQVYPYDRSGYAHFDANGKDGVYQDGVGAYKNDGTLKDNAIVIYVTDENKNTVTVTDPNTGTTVTGIGNILNSVGQACSEAGHENECRKAVTSKNKTTYYYAKANTNQGIIQKLAQSDTPLVVRFVGAVSDSGYGGEKKSFSAASPSLIYGLTAYSHKDDAVAKKNADLVDYGGTRGDNGHMARMKSGKNITLEGIGYDATIDGWGFHFMCESSASQYGKSFEVRNLKFVNTPEDAIGMEGVQKDSEKLITASVERCWIHNNEFYGPSISNPAESDKSEGDGSVDFKRGMYFTCSYNYFEGCHKTNLVGSSDSSLQYNLTYHHNHWYLCKARGPLARQANVHMYNNIVDMQTDYAQNARANAYIFSEYNMFYACKNPYRADSDDKGIGVIKSYHDTVASAEQKDTPGTVVEKKTDIVQNYCKYQNTDYSKFDTDSELSYIPNENNYKLDKDFTELRKTVASQTGVQDRTPKLAKDVKPDEYSVLPKDATLVQIAESSYKVENLKKSKIPWAFTYNGRFNIKIAYDGASGVLVNEAGENLLEGDGEVLNLPAGTYWIQAAAIQAGNAATLAPATFKEITIKSIEIKPTDPNGHYHKWTLETTTPATCTTEGTKVYKCTGEGTCSDNNTKSESIQVLGHEFTVQQSITTQPTCTEKGKGAYKCSRCDVTTEKDVNALGHNWGPWTVTKPATAEAAGEQEHTCTRCNTTEKQTIAAGGTGGGSSSTGGNVTTAGDYELYFTGKQLNGDVGTGKFFQATIASYKDSKGKVTVNGMEYAISATFGSSTISFSCNDGAKLYLMYASSVGQKIKIDEEEITIGSDGSVEIELSGGKHTIEKVSKNEVYLNYVSVKNGASQETYYKLTFDYNYGGETEDDEPPAEIINALAGATYYSLAELAPSAFTREGYKLIGLYTDYTCTKAVTYPYVANADAQFYAEWEEDEIPTGKSYTLFLDTNGGVGMSPVSVSETEIYTITQTPIRAGYVFAGWYTEREGGTPVSTVDGSKMTANMTVYAHWDQLGDDDYLIRYDAGTGTAPAGLEAVVKAEEGNKVTIPADCIPADGFTFKGWSVDGTTVLTGEYTVSGDDAVGNVIIIKALYEKGSGKTGIHIEGVADEYEFTGDKITPAFDVFDYNIGTGKLLVQGVDYTVTYKYNKDVTADQKAQIIVKGKGNYATIKGEELVKEFKIVSANSGATAANLISVKGAKLALVNDSDKSIPYDGKPHYPLIKLTLSDKSTEYEYEYKDGKYEIKGSNPMNVHISVSNNVNKGNATILVKGAEDNGKETKVKAKFKITAVKLTSENASVTVDKTKQPVYSPNGAVLAADALTVKYGNTPLKLGKDYTVKYSNNKKVSDSATVMVTGKGGYTGKLSGTYAIGQASMKDDFMVAGVVAHDGIKTVGKITAAVVNKADGSALKPKKQYTLICYQKETGDDKFEETAEVTAGMTLYVAAKAADTDNLKTADDETERVKVTVGKDIAKVKFAIADDYKKGIPYTGKKITLEEKHLSVQDNLKMGTAYEIVSYSNNINKGTATAVIQGIGEYSGTKTIKFKIGQQPMKLSQAAREAVHNFMKGLFN